jgi:hypothetical protein
LTLDKTSVTNEHLKQNATSDPPDEIRLRRRMAELEEEQAKRDAKADSAPKAGKVK